MSITQFHGVVKKCSCHNPEVPSYCGICLSRGYLATCLACSGTGLVKAPTFGTSGTMNSTCDKCGGKGVFPVKKPEGWIPEDLQIATQALALDALSEAARGTFEAKPEQEDDEEGDEEGEEEGKPPIEGGADLPPRRPSKFSKAKWRAMTEAQRKDLASQGAANGQYP